MRALRIGTRAEFSFTKICARTTTRWSTPRNIWPSSSTGRGAAFFSREKLLVENRPLPLPPRWDFVFAVIDTASKTGTDNDATAVTFFARDRVGKIPLLNLDWDIVQIEGAVLETWLLEVFQTLEELLQTLEELARLCRVRYGSPS